MRSILRSSIKNTFQFLRGFPSAATPRGAGRRGSCGVVSIPSRLSIRCNTTIDGRAAMVSVSIPSRLSIRCNETVTDETQVLTVGVSIPSRLSIRCNVQAAASCSRTVSFQFLRGFPSAATETVRLAALVHAIVSIPSRLSIRCNLRLPARTPQSHDGRRPG